MEERFEVVVLRQVFAIVSEELDLDGGCVCRHGMLMESDGGEGDGSHHPPCFTSQRVQFGQRGYQSITFGPGAQELYPAPVNVLWDDSHLVVDSSPDALNHHHIKTDDCAFVRGREMKPVLARGRHQVQDSERAVDEAFFAN